MTFHPSLAAGRWLTLTLAEQLGNVGGEVSRAAKWKGRDERLYEGAMARAMELLWLTIGDPRWRGRRKELTRLRELLVDASLGGPEYGTTLEGLDRYLFHFAVAARTGRSRRRSS